MTLPLGKWAVNYNGSNGELQIDSVSATGDVTGIWKPSSLPGSVALAVKDALPAGFVRSDGKDGVGHRRCSRRSDGGSTAATRSEPSAQCNRSRGRIARTACRLRNRADKPERREVSYVDKYLDEPHRVVCADI